MGNDKPLSTISIGSITEAMKMLILAQNDVPTTTVQNCFKKAGFSDEEKDDFDDPFSTFKHSIEELQSREETLVPDDVTCDDILAFDEEVVVTQEILTDEMIVAEMRADKSDTNEERGKRRQPGS